jgi:hypothetical protein
MTTLRCTAKQAFVRMKFQDMAGSPYFLRYR